MSAGWWGVIIVVAWGGIDILLLAVNRDVAKAGERFDRTMADHYRDEEGQ